MPLLTSVSSCIYMPHIHLPRNTHTHKINIFQRSCSTDPNCMLELHVYKECLLSVDPYVWLYHFVIEQVQKQCSHTEAKSAPQIKSGKNLATPMSPHLLRVTSTQQRLCGLQSPRYLLSRKTAESCTEKPSQTCCRSSHGSSLYLVVGGRSHPFSSLGERIRYCPRKILTTKVTNNKQQLQGWRYGSVDSVCWVQFPSTI